MASNKKYWRGVEELNENSSIVEKLKTSEFAEDLPTDEFLGDKEALESSSTSRRDFLKYVGFTTAAASLAACEGPVVKSIPYVIKPDEVTPGVADYYATSMANGYDFANLLVKVREGRPIKIEPNKLAGNQGGTNARVQASILALYDNNRLQNPRAKGEPVNWSTFDKATMAELNALKANNETIVFLTGTTASPTTNQLIQDFKASYANVKHIAYDAVSESAALDAFETLYGERALPDYDFSKAEVIVSIGADFLGDWQGGGFEVGYAKSRIPNHGKMSRHVQIESNLSLTGSNADRRYMVKPSEQKQVLLNVYNALVGGGSTKSTSIEEGVKQTIKQLQAAGKKAVVVTGIQDKNAQLLALAINKAIGSEAVNTVAPKYVRSGSDAKVSQLIEDMKAGKVGGLITYLTNPAYTLANSADFVEALKKVKLSIAFSMGDDETASAAQYVGAVPHYLESWGDVRIKKGHFGLTQPTIRPLFNTRQFQDTLLKWNGSSLSYHDYLKAYWKSNVLKGLSWNNTLHDGVRHIGTVADAVETAIFDEEIPSQISPETVSVQGALTALAASIKPADLELELYTKTSMGNGQMANNPWLQELPDPITRTSWDNYITISRVDAIAKEITNRTVSNGALNGDLANITVNGVSLENVPVYIQPGQAPGSIGLALGYGRKSAAVQKDLQVGVNAYPLYQNFSNHQSVTIEKVAGEHEFACIQLQHTLMGRDEIIRETTLDDFVNKPKHDWNPEPHVQLDHQNVSLEKVDLWERFDDSLGTKFNLSIDLATCIGCAACIVACHAENNVPVVGKDEIRKSRDMHWLRIDRYYSSDMTEERGKEEGIFGTGTYFNAQTHPSDNPNVTFQPVMCQHCNHAPCETVCPVAATSHGRQGQNQMAYNRCIGTRYCANNCPYRVRRFNWFKYFDNNEFDYNMNNDLGRMVLNPDVTVRSRGVMEKCSMCIQMTQATILKAKKEGRPVKDGEFTTACVNACSTGAMVFGDVNDKDSKVAHIKEDDRTFHLLDFVGTQPNVFYQVDIRNTNES
ncbi:TAT-variant-translocated molybdopterin oxidoreductase [Aureibaculum sp. A20]|uniref:TAT-variant-translocated molybdopterin oxidoreductase n=1 Tax=Aureibaculum flavum TaxID=2795986 RepID=A0ABS0WP19_9FLAO|nr:TAT-variant-translocated molybdopterin oxidoreductase [Aureibaculum flavum]MBJ2173731.1 TAT-variant-translocated molybdopterin oxidoreductase [Aureibaculum flavum]